MRQLVFLKLTKLLVGIFVMTRHWLITHNVFHRRTTKNPVERTVGEWRNLTRWVFSNEWINSHYQGSGTYEKTSTVRNKHTELCIDRTHNQLQKEPSWSLFRTWLCFRQPRGWKGQELRTLECLTEQSELDERYSLDELQQVLPNEFPTYILCAVCYKQVSHSA